MKVLTLIFMSCFFSVFLIILIFTLNSNKNHDFMNSMGSPFECGFENNMKPKSKFNMQFFFIAILFIIFDLEIILIMPFLIYIDMTMFMSFLVLCFMVALNLILMIEWSKKSLQWKI